MDLREKQKNEAVERMNELNILDQTIKEFKKEGKINKSEFGGILYWLDEEEMSKVKEFEEEYVKSFNGEKMVREMVLGIMEQIEILLDIVGQVWYYNIKEKLECFLQAVL